MKTCALCAAWFGHEPGTHPTTGTCYRMPPAAAFQRDYTIKDTDYPTKSFSEPACPDFVDYPAE